MNRPLHISVVIPTLNEVRHLPETLNSIQKQAPPFEVWVIDGGSQDGTLAWLKAHSIQALTAPKGRASQMNVGARKASGDILLFLHADTCLPPHAFLAIRQALQQPQVVAGCFRLQFAGATGFLGLYGWLTRFKIRAFTFGDRAFFVRKACFEAMGGFADLPLLEDLDFVKRVTSQGAWAFLPQTVSTSARRFRKNGIGRQQLRNVLIWIAFHLGISPHTLKRFYPDASTD